MPDLWKTAYVTLLPKRKPPKQMESNLRPVSLVPFASKVLEHFVCKWAWEALAPNIHSRQYGAVKGGFTTHPLVEMLHLIQYNLDTLGRYVRMLLLDYSKAFDLVNHSILLGYIVAGRGASRSAWLSGAQPSSYNRQQRVTHVLTDLVTLRGDSTRHTAGPTGLRHYGRGDLDTLGPQEDCHVR